EVATSAVRAVIACTRRARAPSSTDSMPDASTQDKAAKIPPGLGRKSPGNGGHELSASAPSLAMAVGGTAGQALQEQPATPNHAIRGAHLHRPAWIQLHLADI